MDHFEVVTIINESCMSFTFLADEERKKIEEDKAYPISLDLSVLQTSFVFNDRLIM